MRRNSITILILILLLYGLNAAGIVDKSAIQAPLGSVQSPTPSLLQTEYATVARVVDGDTIQLSDGRRVRYIGIDTAELGDSRSTVKCFAREAEEKNRELVEGKKVRLEKDVSETDKYSRLLRYVYVENVFVNEYLVREGFASAVSYPPDIKYQELFTSAQNEARTNKKGLWSRCR